MRADLQDGAYFSEEQAAKIECLLCYFEAMPKRATGHIIVRKKVYRGPTPRYERNQGKLFRYSKDRYYNLETQQNADYLQLYGVREKVGSDVMGPYVPPLSLSLPLLSLFSLLSYHDHMSHIHWQEQSHSL